MRIAIIGYGKMGKLIAILAEEKGYDIVLKTNSNLPFEKCNLKDIDVAIDFSTPETAFNNISMVDTTIVKIKKNIWLFTNQLEKDKDDFNKKLYIYKINNLKFAKIIPHSKNPVINELSGGRNAGNIFKIGNNIIRPSQINKSDIYGYGLKLSIIKKINLNNYEEKLIKIILPKNKNISGIHHLSKINKNQYLIDVCLKYSKNY